MTELTSCVRPRLDILSERLMRWVMRLVERLAPSWTPEVSAQRASGGVIRLFVTDHGRVGTSDFREYIFDKFTPGEQRESGTGLGLSIFKLLLERHNGKVGFTSEEGERSTSYLEHAEYEERSNAATV